MDPDKLKALLRGEEVGFEETPKKLPEEATPETMRTDFSTNLHDCPVLSFSEPVEEKPVTPEPKPVEKTVTPEPVAIVSTPKFPSKFVMRDFKISPHVPCPPPTVKPMDIVKPVTPEEIEEEPVTPDESEEIEEESATPDESDEDDSDEGDEEEEEDDDDEEDVSEELNTSEDPNEPDESSDDEASSEPEDESFLLNEDSTMKYSGEDFDRLFSMLSEEDLINADQVQAMLAELLSAMYRNSPEHDRYTKKIMSKFGDFQHDAPAIKARMRHKELVRKAEDRDIFRIYTAVDNLQGALEDLRHCKDYVHQSPVTVYTEAMNADMTEQATDRRNKSAYGTCMRALCVSSYLFVGACIGIYMNVNELSAFTS